MTNTQYEQVIAELVGIGRTLQRIADACDRAESHMTAEDPGVAAQRAAANLAADARRLVAVTEFPVPPQPSTPSPAVRKHKGRRS